MHEDSDVSQVDEGRRPPFCFQTHDALDLIRRSFEPRSIATALAIYLCLTEAANRLGGVEARSGFVAARKEIARSAGVSLDTLDRYVSKLAEIGLIEVIRETVGSVNLPNRWSLRDTPPSRSSGVGGSRSSGVLKDLEEKLEEEEDPPVTPPSTDLAVPTPANRPATVNRKPVKDDEYELAAAALHSFNGQANSRYESGEWISKIVMRIREHPEVSFLGHAAVITRVLNGKRWWDGDPSPSIVYGNAALFERNLHAAARPPDPNQPMTVDQLRKHFENRGDVVEGEAVEVVDA